MSINAGSVLSTIITPILRGHLKITFAYKTTITSKVYDRHKMINLCITLNVYRWCAVFWWRLLCSGLRSPCCFNGYCTRWESLLCPGNFSLGGGSHVMMPVDCICETNFSRIVNGHVCTVYLAVLVIYSEIPICFDNSLHNIHWTINSVWGDIWSDSFYVCIMYVGYLWAHPPTKWFKMVFMNLEWFLWTLSFFISPLEFTHCVY